MLLSNALAGRNEVSVILLRNLVPGFLYPGREWIGKNAPTVCFADGIPVFDGMDWSSPVSWIKAQRFLQRHQPDALVMLWWSSAVAHMQLFLIASNRLSPRTKVILEMHEVLDPLEERMLPVRLYSRVVGRLLMKSADALTVHSSEVKAQVSQIYGVPDDEIVVKPFGLYEDYHHPYDKDEAKGELAIGERFVILSFGSIRRYKGISFLVKAFSALPGPIAEDSRLVIAGEDWGDDEDFWALVKASPHRDQITVHPHLVPDQRLPLYFSAADLVVLPYLRTAGSGVASIAMAYGKPILTSDVPTMKELLAAYPLAWFAPPGDATAIVERIEDMYCHGATRGIGHQVLPSDTWEEIAATYETIVERLSGAKPPA